MTTSIISQLSLAKIILAVLLVWNLMIVTGTVLSSILCKKAKYGYFVHNDLITNLVIQIGYYYKKAKTIISYIFRKTGDCEQDVIELSVKRMKLGTSNDAFADKGLYEHFKLEFFYFNNKRYTI